MMHSSAILYQNHQSMKKSHAEISKLNSPYALQRLYLKKPNLHMAQSQPQKTKVYFQSFKAGVAKHIERQCKRSKIHTKKSVLEVLKGIKRKEYVLDSILKSSTSREHIRFQVTCILQSRGCMQNDTSLNNRQINLRRV